MTIELRKKSQITLPKEVINSLNLQEGDRLEVSVENGVIKLEPVAIYPKGYILKLEEEIKELRENDEIGRKTFTNIDELIKSLKEGE